MLCIDSTEILYHIHHHIIIIVAYKKLNTHIGVTQMCCQKLK